MLGAIIGDIAGSIYEFEQFKKCHPIDVKSKLITKDSFFSDDTILTIAILDAILNTDSDDRFPDYEKYLRKYGNEFLNYEPKTNAPHFPSPFSPVFANWLKSEYYSSGYSNGNGAMMRISPIAYLFDDADQVEVNTIHATYTSHSSYEARKCTLRLVEVIYLARQGYSGIDIARKLDLSLRYGAFEKFNGKCYETIDNCLAVALSARNFEDAIRTIISLGGDTDTNACIVGGIAEALFGIPEELKQQALEKLPTDFVTLLSRGYEIISGAH